MVTRQERARSRVLSCLAEAAGYADMLNRPDLAVELREMSEQVEAGRVSLALDAAMRAPRRRSTTAKEDR